jgi:hypothetical protein
VAICWALWALAAAPAHSGPAPQTTSPVSAAPNSAHMIQRDDLPNQKTPQQEKKKKTEKDDWQK